MKIKLIVSLIFFYVSTTMPSLYAQVKVVTPQLIDQYNLDFSPPIPPEQPKYKLVTGSNGALYLQQKSSGEYELISKASNGVPVPVIKYFQNRHSSRLLYDASEDFNRIAYVSDSKQISFGDTDGSRDVFIYDRTTGKTQRAAGIRPHRSRIRGLRISPEGKTVIFESWDRGLAGYPGAKYSEDMVYVYDVEGDHLSPLPYNSGDLDFPARLSVPDFGTPAFTLDGKSAFIFSSNIFFIDYVEGLHAYDISTNVIREVDTGALLFDLKALSNDIYIYTIAQQVSQPTYDFSFYLSMYNSGTGESTILPIEQTDWGNNLTLAATSDNGDYAAFFSTFYNNNDGELDPTAGVLHILDTSSGEFRQAFTPRNALYNVVYDDEYDNPCGISLYAMTDEFYNTVPEDLPCNIDPVYNRPAQGHEEYIFNSLDGYNLETGDVQFHHEGRYLSFRASSWFVDYNIPYNSYDSFILAGERNHFVVPNPFTSMISVDGSPGLNRITEKGWYIWRDNGKWHSEFLAGGKRLYFNGTLISTAPLSNLSTVSIEPNDTINLSSPNRLDFSLNVTGPYRDGFSFIVSDQADTCVQLNSNQDQTIYLGPDRIIMPQSFNLKNLQACP